MAEKEERILISTRHYSEETKMTHTDMFNEYSRQDAIERMAKGIHFYEWGHHNNMPKWEELNTDIQNDYKNMAEAALNALLGE